MTHDKTAIEWLEHLRLDANRRGNHAEQRYANAALAALHAKAGVSVEVKELEWSHVLNQGWRPSMYEALITGDVAGEIGPFIYHSPDKFHAQSFDTLEAAKAAAQADYDARIKIERDRAEADNKLLSERVAVKDAALEPFANISTEYDRAEDHVGVLTLSGSNPKNITVSHLRRARSAREA